MLAFTRTDLERLFPSTTWERAESLRDQSAVVEINVERDGRSITGRVRGERRTPLPDAGEHRQRARRPDPAVQHLHLPGLQRVRACGGDAAGGPRRDRRTGRRRGQRRDRPRARGLDRRDQPERARADQRACRRRCRLRALRAGAGAAAVARRGVDPAACGQHVPRPTAARRPLRPRASAGDVQPGGRRSGQLRRHRRSGDRPAARRAATRRPSGWARSATATRCGGCWRPAAATGATARRPPCPTRIRVPAASAGISTARASSTSSASSRMPRAGHGRRRPRRALVHRPREHWPAAGSRPACRIASPDCCSRRPAVPASVASLVAPEAAAERRNLCRCPSRCASASGWRCARRRSCICTARR